MIGPLEYSEIAQGLSMGSRPSVGLMARLHGFDIVVFTAKEYQPPVEWYPGTRVARITLNDAELPTKHALEAVHLATHLARAIRRGEKVLVTCNQGRNRSGLIAALTLAKLTGCSGLKASLVVKSKRNSPYGEALTNHDFIRALSAVREKKNPGPVTRAHARVVGS